MDQRETGDGKDLGRQFSHFIPLIDFPEPEFLQTNRLETPFRLIRCTSRAFWSVSSLLIVMRCLTLLHIPLSVTLPH